MYELCASNSDISTSTITSISPFQTSQQSSLSDKMSSLSHEKELLLLENTNLKLEVDILKREVDKLSDNERENDRLRAELSAIRLQHANDYDRLSDKLEFELKAREEAYRERDELMRTHQIELNAVKIRFENELGKQNAFMQRKYDSLNREIHRLNELIARLERDKKELVEQVKYERELNNRQLAARRNDIVFASDAKPNERF